MRPGEVIAERFTLKEKIAAGGMGQVFRATDSQTGEIVAVKVQLRSEPQSLARFLQEAALLAEIRHPGIVRYIAHGRLDADSAYLAMEWLEGEDLGRYLRRAYEPKKQHQFDSTLSHRHTETPTVQDYGSRAAATPSSSSAPRSMSSSMPSASISSLTASEHPLPIDEILVFGRRLASAVAELHRRGVVHRDIKPANLFLPNGALDYVKLLDLGAARPAAHEHLTEPGSILGTPHYMAPEQARASGTVTPATDVWAIGCVLYQSITGTTPFTGVDILAVLASIILDQPVPIQVLRADVPQRLSKLIMSTLEKEPAARPQSGDALAAAIEELISVLGQPSGLRSAERAGSAAGIAAPRLLTNAESRVTSMLFVAPGKSEDKKPADSSQDQDHPGSAGRAAAMANAAVANTAVEDKMRTYGGQVQRLADGTMLIVFPEALAPADLASRAARAALALRDGMPGLAMALATGRTEAAGSAGPMAAESLGPVVEAAVRALRAAGPGEIRADELTASLLNARFELSGEPGSMRLFKERPQEATRTLLGKPSRWVGRRRELSTLIATFDECAEEQVARAVLVTAPAGMGKSRLRHEFVSALKRRGDEFELIYGQGDVVSAGSPFIVIAPALRHLAHIVDTEPVEDQRKKLRARLAETVAAAELERICLFLGELCNVPFPDLTSATLRAARKDPVFLGQLMKAAWEDWLCAECNRRPVLLVVEDLDWGDLPSVSYIDGALHELRNQPFMVLALGRPEVRKVFPNLWHDRDLYELPLLGLPPKASSTLVRDALGEDTPQVLVDDLVVRAGGNAFYLEELIRAVAEHKDEKLPDTVLGMVQVRLDALGPQVKRILRAGSIFGQVFWKGGVEALLGESGAFDIGEWLSELVSREVIRRQPTSRLPGEHEYRFSHALVRDGAYAALTEKDRRLGHALAGKWLEAVGERDGTMLAEHFMRGGLPARALPYYCRAAEQALEGNDFEAVIARVERAVEAGACGETLGMLRALECMAYYWLSNYPRSQACGVEAARLLPPGDARWFSAISSALVSSFRIGDRAQGDELLSSAIATPSEPGADVEQLICLCRCTIQLALDGRFDQADAILEKITLLAARTQRLDPRTTAHIHIIRGYRAAYEGSWEPALRFLNRAVEAFIQAGDMRNMLMEQTSVAGFWAELGHFEHAAALCERNLVECRRMSSPMAIHFARCHLGYFWTYCPDRRDEAKRLLLEVVDEYQRGSNLRMEGWAMGRLATWEYLAGDYAAAERAAGRAGELLMAARGFLPWALAVHARSLLALGRVDDALVQAERAVALLRSLGGALHRANLPLHALAEVRHAAGDHEGACTALSDAAQRVARSAKRITDAKDRARFLAIPEYAATVTLARAWGLVVEGMDL